MKMYPLIITLYIKNGDFPASHVIVFRGVNWLPLSFGMIYPVVTSEATLIGSVSKLEQEKL